MILDIRVVLKCFSFYGTETRQMEQKHRSLKVNYIVVIRERERQLPVKTFTPFGKF